ncbi:hypothetical protein [Nannocystis punicea]|uniref:Uncharacterized protein n=1 Tax=Nannocystis punicea TaxID=2995304 RepID=A0ABY7H0K4_9BACT|nr:hypothetical protein [Nannocystis poenicansa]WAS92635.1 hypothetical protein O0S08_41175 [Nannocystis poenicansa]
MPAPPTTVRDRAQLCYTTAYFVLPRCIAADPAKLLRDLETQPRTTPAVMYLMACELEDSEPHEQDVAALTVQPAALGDRLRCQVLAYPHYPPVGVVLPPYFSVLVHAEGEAEVLHYFILGQSPTGATTLRTVTPDEANVNLGPGPEPTADALLAVLRDRLADVDAALPRRRWWQFWR